MTDDKVKACRQDVLDWIDNGMPAGALNFSETLRDSIKAIANEDALQAERDKLSAEVERLTDGWNSAQVEWREIQEVYRQFCADLGCASAAEVADKLTSAEAKLTALVEALETAAEWLNATPEGYHGALGELNRRKINDVLASLSAPPITPTSAPVESGWLSNSIQQAREAVERNPRFYAEMASNITGSAPVEDDVHFIEAALSWYCGTVAQADVHAAWSRIKGTLIQPQGEERS